MSVILDAGALILRLHSKHHALRTDLRHMYGPHVCAFTDPIEDRTRPHSFAKQTHIRIVEVQNCNPILRQRLDQLILRPRNPRNPIGKKLEVHRPNV